MPYGRICLGTWYRCIEPASTNARGMSCHHISNPADTQSTSILPKFFIIHHRNSKQNIEQHALKTWFFRLHEYRITAREYNRNGAAASITFHRSPNKLGQSEQSLPTLWSKSYKNIATEQIQTCGSGSPFAPCLTAC